MLLLLHICVVQCRKKKKGVSVCTVFCVHHEHSLSTLVYDILSVCLYMSTDTVLPDNVFLNIVTVVTFLATCVVSPKNTQFY